MTATIDHTDDDDADPTVDDILDDVSLDDLDDAVVPALCRWDCMVEPDGHCEHGRPSVLIALGVAP